METVSISVKLNGEVISLHNQFNLAAILTQKLKLDSQKAQGSAVAVNEEIIPKTQWNSITLKEGDRIEVIQATQGG